MLRISPVLLFKVKKIRPETFKLYLCKNFIVFYINACENAHVVFWEIVVFRLSFMVFLLSGIASEGFSVNENEKGAEEGAVPLGFARGNILEAYIPPTSESSSSEGSSKKSSPTEEKISIPGSGSPSPTNEAQMFLQKLAEYVDDISLKDDLYLSEEIRQKIEAARQKYDDINTLKDQSDIGDKKEIARRNWKRSAPSMEALEVIRKSLPQNARILSIATDQSLWEESLSAIGYDVTPLGLRSGGLNFLEMLSPVSHTYLSEGKENDALFLNGVNSVACPEQGKEGYAVGNLSDLIGQFKGNYAVVIDEDHALWKKGWSKIQETGNIYSFTEKPMALTVYERLKTEP